MTFTRRRWLGAALAAPLTGAATVRAADADWARTLAEARGQTVYFDAWAGSERINGYLQWAAGELQRRHGVRLEHVKIADTAEAIQRLRAEKAAGRAAGSIDMLWINGENFLHAKREGLLWGPFAERLPSYAFVDTTGKPTTRVDFSEPVDGMEAPWGMAQLTFYGERARVPRPPGSIGELADWARAHPGRLTYPRPPQFHGTAFVEQVLLELTADRAPLYRPVGGDAFARVTAPLWPWLDRLHPLLWRRGRAFPASIAALRQMVADGELSIGLTFNPNDAATEIAAGRLPADTRAWQHRAGTVGNTHFLAIAFNARARAGAQVAIDFLLSPLAQARKADIAHWGDPTVLALDRLDAADRARFAAAQAPGMVEAPAPAWPEPHASWIEPLEREWTRRYGA